MVEVISAGIMATYIEGRANVIFADQMSQQSTTLTKLIRYNGSNAHAQWSHLPANFLLGYSWNGISGPY